MRLLADALSCVSLGGISSAHVMVGGTPIRQMVFNQALVQVLRFTALGRLSQLFRLAAGAVSFSLLNYMQHGSLLTGTMNSKLLDLLDTQLPHGSVSVTAPGDGAPVVLSITPEAGLPLEGVHLPDVQRGGATHTSEVIWRAADVGVKVLTSNLPPPLSWLIGGGWWFMKRVFNAPVDGNDYTYYLYTTANDAELNNPVKAAGAISRTPLNGDISVQQMTLPDVVSTNNVVSAARTIVPPFRLGYVAMSVGETLWSGFLGKVLLPDEQYCCLAIELSDTLKLVFASVYIVEPTFLEGAEQLAVVRRPSGKNARLGFQSGTAFEGRGEALLLATSGPLPSTNPVSTGLVLFQSLSNVSFTRPMRGREVNRDDGREVLNLVRYHSISTQTQLSTSQYYLGVCFGQANEWSGLQWVTGYQQPNSVPASGMNYIMQASGWSLSPYMTGLNSGLPQPAADPMAPFLVAFPEYCNVPTTLFRQCSLAEDGERRMIYRRLLSLLPRDFASRGAWAAVPPHDFVCLLSRYIAGLQDGLDPQCAADAAVEFSECRSPQ
nr:structural protein [Porcupine astrovirus 1]